MNPYGRKTKEEIYNEMLQELRLWCPEVPESSERLDPVIKLLLGSMAQQVEKLSSQIDLTWDKTFKALVRNILVEGQRWPVPAYTVMRCEPTDKTVDIHTSVHFVYKEKTEESKDFFFTPLLPTKLISADIHFAFFSDGKELVEFKKKDVKQLVLSPRIVPLSGREKISEKAPPEYLLYLGICYEGESKDFSDTCLFFNTSNDVLGQLRWGKWYLSSKEGYFLEQNSYWYSDHIDSCPWGKTSFMEWGGLRRGSDLFQDLFMQFFHFPENKVSKWEKCRIPADIQKFVSVGLIEQPTSDSKEIFWVKISLPDRGDKNLFKNLLTVYFNCFLAINRRELSIFKYTLGSRLVEIELPEDFTQILSVDSVEDSNGREYLNRYIPTSIDSFRYFTEEKDNRMILWFDFSNFEGNIPNSITVRYSVTSGTQANGIERGQIQQLYQSHPGIKSVTNITPSEGGIPAKTQEEIMDGVSSLLRNRGRAVSFAEIENWTRQFDSRIREARCENAVQKGALGARRVTLVNIRVNANQFYSDRELELLNWRLINFIKARALINTQIDIKIKAD